MVIDVRAKQHNLMSGLKPVILIDFRIKNRQVVRYRSVGSEYGWRDAATTLMDFPAPVVISPEPTPGP